MKRSYRRRNTTRSKKKRSRSHLIKSKRSKNKSGQVVLYKSPRKHRSPKNDDWKFLVRVVDGLTMPYIASLNGFYPRIGAQTDSRGTWYPGIYTTYLSSKLNADWIGNVWNHTDIFGEHVFVFHPKVLQDLPFGACNADMGGECRDPRVSDEVRQNLLLLESKGKLRSPPDTSIIDSWINTFLDPEEGQNPNVWAAAPLKQKQFVKWKWLNKWLNKVKKPQQEWVRSPIQWSHEVIFDSIPLKYVCHIFTYNIAAVPSLRAYFPKIPISFIRRPFAHERFYFRDYIVPQLKLIYKRCVNSSTPPI